MPPIVLKIKDNESFLPFSNLDQEELSKTWRVCTKVKDSLENGSRLENLSWRLWFIQNVLVSSDVKSKTKFQKWSSSTTKKMETEKELEPTTAYNNNSDSFISPQTMMEEQPKSVLDYSLNEIKSVGTENFVLNQFTSDQQDDQMIELKDIFPFGMQDFMYTVPSENPVSDNQIVNNSSYPSYDNTSSWQPNNQSNSTIATEQNTAYNFSNSNENVQYASNLPSSYTPSVSNPTTMNNNYVQQNFLADPISGIHSLFADHLEFPSLTIPANDENMTHSQLQQQQQQQQSNLIVDFNNAAYVAAAAAATAAALTTLPNATLHNKLLATLPRQTLASAERLLSPAAKRPSTIAQAHQQRQKMTESLPQTSLNRMELSDHHHHRKQKQQQQHYFSTFQLNTGNSPTTTKATNRYVQEYNSSNNSSGQNSPTTEEKPPICSNCDATSTPLWRRSADDKVLCNACGLYLKLHNAPRPKHLKPSNGKNKDGRLYGSDIDGENTSDSEDRNITPAQPQITCTNCGTGKTPLWRRDAAGKALCNACGLYFKLHNENRPLSMKTDIIKKRQRAETLIASTDSSESSGIDPNSKKPRYYDQQSLYSTDNGNGTTLGYRQSSSSLPGTGILMMTPSSTSSL